MKWTHTVVIGAGQAGLAMSRCLSDRAIAHVVLERGRVAERWRTERWDSLRLLTPNWLSRLPGFRYEGPDPDGYMTMPDVVDYLERFARFADAPVAERTAVTRVERYGSGFRVETTGGTWRSANVVVATGYCDEPVIPAFGAGLTDDITQTVPTRYRNPSKLPPGGVLIVGASASGVQLADELRAAGRDVVIAVGRHTRLPRTYRGKDILWWLDVMGMLGASADDVFDLEVSRHQPSLQLVGRPDRRTLDLGVLRAQGVRIVGRLLAAEGERVRFDDDLFATTAAADAKLATLIARIDAFVEKGGLTGSVEPPEPFTPLWPQFTSPVPATLDLKAEGIGTVLWATGFRRRYPWLAVPVLDLNGEIRHTGGVTPIEGLYVIGLTFLRRRNSAFIDGVGGDARELADHIAKRRGAAA